MNYKYVESEDVIKQHLVRVTETQLRLFDVIYEEFYQNLNLSMIALNKNQSTCQLVSCVNRRGERENHSKPNQEGTIPATKNEGERSYKIPRLEYYETRTEVKSKTSLSER